MRYLYLASQWWEARYSVTHQRHVAAPGIDQRLQVGVGLAAGSHESAVAAMMTITWVYALLALVLAANAVVAFEAIFKLEEPRGPR